MDGRGDHLYMGWMDEVKREAIDNKVTAKSGFEVLAEM